jgi:hypothetical protein
VKDVVKEVTKLDYCYVTIVISVIIPIVWTHLLIMYLTEDGNVNGMLDRSRASPVAKPGREFGPAVQIFLCS